MRGITLTMLHNELPPRGPVWLTGWPSNYCINATVDPPSIK